MGFQLGPKLLRRPPKGWLPARAFPLRHGAYEHHNSDPDGGERVLETSAGLTVTWRVELPGREPYEFKEERAGPAWLLRGFTGGGKRWYKLRFRPSYGLMADVGVPCFVDPQDPHELWIDWDRAYDEHVPAWEREARVQRELARRDGAWDHAFDRVFNPFAGRLQPGEEQIVEQRAERTAVRQQQVIDHSRQLADLQTQARGGVLPQPGEAAELRRRQDELARIQRTGRRLRAKVVAREETDRTFAAIPLIVLTFELDDGSGPRRVVFEHCFGPRHAKHYKVGRKVDVWLDPQDPDALCPGR